VPVAPPTDDTENINIKHHYCVNKIMSPGNHFELEKLSAQQQYKKCEQKLNEIPVLSVLNK